MNASNATLAKQVQGDDPAAFAQLFGRYHALVFSVCLNFLGHRQDAEDATQETFSRVARYLHRWDPQRPLEPWLIAIAGNRCRTALSRRSQTRPLTMAPDASGLDQIASGAAADAWVEQNSADVLREELTLAMQRLPSNHRRAFQLFHEQCLPYAEIAERMDCPLGTVKTWVHRARQKLVQALIEREVISDTSFMRQERK